MIYGSEEFNDTLVAVIKEKYRHPYYERACKIAREMSVHVYGEKPVDLLNRVRPGEDEVIKQYRLDNYEPTTKAPCGKAIKIVSKIFNPNLSSIIFPNTANAKKLKEYTMEYYPEYNSLAVFNKDVTLKKMIADANAVMAVKPQRKPRNDAERVKPIVLIYGSENVWNWDYDHFLVYLYDKKEEDDIVYTFDYFDYKQIIRFEAKIINTASKQQELVLEVIEDESYVHNFTDKTGAPTIPAWRLGGNSVPLGDGEIVYESFFADAQAHWNLSIIHQSDIQGSFTKHMNPQRMVIGEECHNQRQIDGVLFRCSHGLLRSGMSTMSYPCEVCNGSGKVSSSPYEDNIILKTKLEEISSLSIQPVEYVKVPVDATKLLVEQAKDMVREGNAAINMDVEDKVGENQSGIAKVYDRSAQNNTIYDIGSRMYDVIFNNQFYFMNKYMNGTEDASAQKNTDENLPQVNKPTSFNIESISEMLAGLKQASEAGVDRNVQQAKEIAYLSRDMETNPMMKTYYVTLINLDPLYRMTQDDIDINLMKGLVYKTDAVVHANLKPFVDRALQQNAKFLELKKEDQLVILKTYADELITAEQPKIDTTLLNGPASFSQGN